jgi:carboxylesterase type B
MYDGSSLVSNAVNNGKPFVFVAVNYRVGGFGFMPVSLPALPILLYPY